MTFQDWVHPSENTRLIQLNVRLSGISFDTTNKEIFEGIKCNISIRQLSLSCGGYDIVGGVAQEILKAYQENNSCLTRLHISVARLRNGGDRVIAEMLRSCKNIKSIDLYGCIITDDHLLPIVEAVQGHTALTELSLHENTLRPPG